MNEFKLRKRSPEEQTLYYIEAIKRVEAERDAIAREYAKLVALARIVLHDLRQRAFPDKETLNKLTVLVGKEPTKCL